MHGGEKMTICGKLKNKEEELKRHSIFILSDDKDTDYEFCVLVDDENNPKNEFLKELFKFLKNRDEKKFADAKHKEELKRWLGISDDNDDYLTVLNWLKIAIEKYPYRLFVAVDNPDNYKNKSNKSQFIKQRICWVKKEELKQAFLNKNNHNLLEIKNLNDKNKPTGNNLIKSLNPSQRAILWLYYKWIEHIIEHIMKITKYENKKINIDVEVGVEQDYFIPITSPFKETKRSNQTYSIKDKITYGKVESPLISFSRHEPFATTPLYNNFSFLYSQGYSGSQFQYNIIIPSTDNFNQYYKTMLFVENALFKKLIFDERFQNFYTSQTKKVKQKLICSGLFPVKEIKSIFKFDEGEGIVLEKENNNFKMKIEDIEKVMKKNNNDLHPEIYNGNYLYLLIIHQGILDKIKENPRKLILNLKDTFPFIQITSGRGKPENVPKGEKFIEFSNIEQVMKEYPEDLILTKIAFKVIASKE